MKTFRILEDSSPRTLEKRLDKMVNEYGWSLKGPVQVRNDSVMGDKYTATVVKETK